ncbi:MAG: class II aldolase/adducin family protein [Elusimicrobiota bacterium]|nr:class II aldolase/adducin family protein [Elusimicrobiota bacterium]
MFNDIIKFGREMMMQGLNNSHSGNVSCRRTNTIYITRHGARLGDLSFQDFVAVNLKDDKRDKDASIEIKVHRAIYLANPQVEAIVHAHPPAAIALSLNFEKIIPVDMEGSYYLPEIPVLSECKEVISSECVAENLPKLLSKYKIVVIKGHGSFAVGKNFEEAYLYTSVCESASKIIILNKTAKVGGLK